MMNKEAWNHGLKIIRQDTTTTSDKFDWIVSAMQQMQMEGDNAHLLVAWGQDLLMYKPDMKYIALLLIDGGQAALVQQGCESVGQVLQDQQQHLEKGFQDVLRDQRQQIESQTEIRF